MENGMRINDELVTRYSSSQTSVRASNCHTTWLSYNFVQTRLKIVRLLHKQSNYTTRNQIDCAAQPVLRRLFDRVWGPLCTGYLNISYW